MGLLAQPRAGFAVVAEISNLLYRRFPIGKSHEWIETLDCPAASRLEALRYSRLEICATRPRSPCLGENKLWGKGKAAPLFRAPNHLARRQGGASE